MLNLASLLENSAQKYASKTAFTFMDTSLSFAQINGAANQVANTLGAAGPQCSQSNIRPLITSFNEDFELGLLPWKRRTAVNSVDFQPGQIGKGVQHADDK